MRPRRPREIEDMLLQKFGFEEDETAALDHRSYVLRLQGLPPIWTKVSHSREPIRDKLQAAIAKELRVRSSFYDRMMECNHSREEYVQQVRDDPYPPWDVRNVMGSSH